MSGIERINSGSALEETERMSHIVENLLAMLPFGLIIASIAHHFSIAGQRRAAALSQTGS